jgi:hypothetical protein
MGLFDFTDLGMLNFTFSVILLIPPFLISTMTDIYKVIKKNLFNWCGTKIKRAFRKAGSITGEIAFVKRG